MRAGKEEESKAMGPMFPRLHVNDANQGGPRAPPRNKMALYEQLSVPSQRFNSNTSSSTRPQQKGDNLAPSNSSNQGGGNKERPFFSSFDVPTHTAAYSSDKVNLQSTDAPHPPPAGTDSERRPIKLVRRESTDAPHLPPAGTDSERRPIKLVRRESTDAPHPPPAGTDSERRPIKLVRREVLSSSKHNTAPDSSSPRANEASRRDSCSKKPVEDDDFMVPTLFKQKTQATEKVLLGQGSGDKSAKKFMALPKFSSENSNINTKILEKGEGCSNSEREKGEGKERRDREELEALHDGFMEETMLGISISPDDVVSAIGHKTFWKARRLIVNQQRVFAVQLFELHRLIKVQKLIAASPDVLLQSDSLLGKKLAAPIKPVPAIGSNLIAQSQGSKYTDEPQMIKNIPEYSKETIVVGVDNNTSNQEPLPSHEAPEHSQARSTAAVNSAALPMAPPENKPSNSCCLPPVPNQWLVPVMSPSEGLVYKPYSGPYSGSYPPAGSFISPFFPGCAAPVPIPTATGDFMNSAYGVPMPMPVSVPPHPPQNMGAVGLPNYFPPFGMQVMNQNPSMIPNPVMSTSAVEQVSHLVASKNNGPVYVEQQSRSSCNMAELKSDAFSGCMWGFRASKDSELQGSTASSPFDRGDALPLFQTRSASTDAFLPKPSPSGGAGNIARVIKVVPHNPQLATESAARIFQSIQKERKQNDT